MTMIPRLREFCLQGGNQPVAIDDGDGASSIFTCDDLRDNVRVMAAALAERPEHTWALWLTSPWEFLCAFMALALAHKRILLPGNMQPQTALLLAEHFDAVISRTPTAQLGRPNFTPEQLNDPGNPPAMPQPAFARDIELLLFTSGSTGEPQAIAKTLALLETELVALQQLWGARLGQKPVLATVSHQHIYGLLHAVLWPLWRGAPFINELCQYPEQLMERAKSRAPVVLVSSPTHLKRLPEVADFVTGATAVAEVVSSGGLLETEVALALADLLGQAPLEVLGSTETGGVAWRQQNLSQHWRPLPGVSCEQDAASQCLRVRSDHLGAVAKGTGQFVMGDKVTLHDDGSFSLRGRADQVVKVEGKRLSVTEMENHLQSHPLVEHARIVVVRARREEVGAAVVLSSAGQDQLAELGKLALNQQLRSYLLAFFERPLLPRRWRYLTELPLNAQGKVVAGDVQALLMQKEVL